MKKTIIFGLVFLLLISSTFASYCYQESPNVKTDCGGLGSGVTDYTNPTFLYLNYTIPDKALTSSIWQVKHGDLSRYNVTMDKGCFSSILRLRFYSNIKISYGQCYTNSGWINLTQIEESSGINGIAGITSGPNLIDGLWNTSSVSNGTHWGDYVFGSSSSGRIFEEGVHWNFEDKDSKAGVIAAIYNQEKEIEDNKNQIILLGILAFVIYKLK